ncbi:unnamed protein product, partial [marine sediment metagenome]
SFLQASQDERRAIFDEAAGINKYKARRKEALRKLERVEQNLLRLEDILGEVQKRLRSIKYQAGKARNYQTYCERLKELRSLHFLAQYHLLSIQRNQLQKRLDAASDCLSQIVARVDQLEAAQSGTEVEAIDLDRSARDVQSRIATVSGQITACQQRAEMLDARVKELEEQFATGSARCEELEAKLDQVRQQVTGRQAELEQIENSMFDMARKHQAVRGEHRSGERTIVDLQAKLEDEKAGTIDLLRRTAQLHNEIHGLDIRRENLQSRR